MDYDKDYHDSLFNRLEMFVRNSENENRASYTLLPEQIITASHVLSISTDSVLDFLDIAIEQTYLLLDNETFYTLAWCQQEECQLDRPS